LSNTTDEGFLVWLSYVLLRNPYKVETSETSHTVGEVGLQPLFMVETSETPHAVGEKTLSTLSGTASTVLLRTLL